VQAHSPIRAKDERYLIYEKCPRNVGNDLPSDYGNWLSDGKPYSSGHVQQQEEI